ncbi:urease accessory protein [Actinoplanes octamycinicus]|uniref:Urease accessory protein UreD n=1 Tax=Actinoplanes octamycinicus TaxID=135948 RepID=A0A7W7MCU1_9ACTN|nr:urease accessory protein UreD [Actinoplanes octamycinicus]MBB4745516.1 urease accessory protein [Actinoplanes octamycinicus]GIE56357.1 urease accessory protein UreD [Actinoplanes octamycinicus]
MRAEARIVAEADGRGGTRLAVLRGQSPLLLRQTGSRHAAAPPHAGGLLDTGGLLDAGGVRDTGGVTVHLVGGAAGPLRGDDLRLVIEVGQDARLTLRSVAAQLALPGRPAPPSRMTVTATVAAGGTLRWLPEPLIAAAGSDHVAITRVAVEAGGSLWWRDDLVCGRHAEESGDFVADTLVRYAGSTLHRHELAVGPRAPGWTGPAVLGTGRAVGTLLLAGPAAAAAADRGVTGTHAAIMPLAGPGVLATAVAPDIRAVRAALDPLCRHSPAPVS